MPGGQAGGGLGTIALDLTWFYVETRNPWFSIPRLKSIGWAIREQMLHGKHYGLRYYDDPVSPGGGGPEAAQISTTPPLSLEATGASLAQLGKSGGPASSSKRRSRPRRKCKPGYRWNGTRCVPKY